MHRSRLITVFVDCAEHDYERSLEFWGVANGPVVPVDHIVRPSCCVKFGLPTESVQATVDFQNWRGYFDRETEYSDSTVSSILARWVRFVCFHNQGFQFETEFVNNGVHAVIPTILFFGADWIRFAPPL